MPIEVRQLHVKSTVEAATSRPDAECPEPIDLAALKAEILRECQEWFETRLQRLQER